MRQHTPTRINQFILDVVKTKQPNTVKELVQLVQEEFPIPEEELMRCIMDLSNQGKLKFIEYRLPTTLKGYLFSIKSSWYWSILALAIATTVTVFIIPENAYPFVYARYTLGSIFVLFLPGYSLIKVLFPTKELDNIERAALGIGISLALVPITGLLLNYTPWGIRTTSTTVSLLALTIIFATVAVIREQQEKLKENQQHFKNT